MTLTIKAKTGRSMYVTASKVEREGNRYTRRLIVQNKFRSRLPAQSQSSAFSTFDLKPSAVPKKFVGVNHVGVLIQDLDKSLDFYQNTLGLNIFPRRPNSLLPYRGAWLDVGRESMVHLMELGFTMEDNENGAAKPVQLNVQNLCGVVEKLKEQGIPFQRGRNSEGPSFINLRDPDMHLLTVYQAE